MVVPYFSMLAPVLVMTVPLRATVFAFEPCLFYLNFAQYCKTNTIVNCSTE